MDWLTSLAGNVPAAVAVIVMASLFLKAWSSERKSQEQRDERFFNRLSDIQNGSNEVIKENTQVNQKMCDHMERLASQP